MKWLYLLTIVVNVYGALTCLKCAVRKKRAGKNPTFDWIAFGLLIFLIIFWAKLI